MFSKLLMMIIIENNMFNDYTKVPNECTSWNAKKEELHVQME